MDCFYSSYGVSFHESLHACSFWWYTWMGFPFALLCLPHFMLNSEPCLNFQSWLLVTSSSEACYGRRLFPLTLLMKHWLENYGLSHALRLTNCRFGVIIFLSALLTSLLLLLPLIYVSSLELERMEATGRFWTRLVLWNWGGLGTQWNPVEFLTPGDLWPPYEQALRAKMSHAHFPCRVSSLGAFVELLLLCSKEKANKDDHALHTYHLSLNYLGGVENCVFSEVAPKLGRWNRTTELCLQFLSVVSLFKRLKNR